MLREQYVTAGDWRKGLRLGGAPPLAGTQRQDSPWRETREGPVLQPGRSGRHRGLVRALPGGKGRDAAEGRVWGHPRN